MAHAALSFSLRHPRITAQWQQDSEHLVVLCAADEPALYDLWCKAQNLELVAVAFFEPDLDDALTALALEPKAAKLVSPFSLLGEGVIT